MMEDGPSPHPTTQTTQQWVVALYSYTPTAPHELYLEEGDHLLVLEKQDGGWWKVDKNGKRGFIPCNYVELL